MAMDTVHTNFVTSAASECRVMLNRYGPLGEDNVLWQGTPDWKDYYTQELIDSIPLFKAAGLTVQNLNDAMYALELIRGNMTNAMVALTVLSKCI